MRHSTLCIQHWRPLGRQEIRAGAPEGKVGFSSVRSRSGSACLSGFLHLPRVKGLVFFCFLCFVSSGCYAGDTPRICFKDSCYQVDVMDTLETRERGLMFREGLPPGRGMFFVFDRSGEYAFWMKNMTFPIDILWLNEDRVIVHIEENVPPCTQDPCAVYVPHARARYVLEIPAGDSRRQGISMGETAKIPFLSTE